MRQTRISCELHLNGWQTAGYRPCRGLAHGAGRGATNVTKVMWTNGQYHPTLSLGGKAVLGEGCPGVLRFVAGRLIFGRKAAFLSPHLHLIPFGLFPRPHRNVTLRSAVDSMFLYVCD